MRIFTPVRERRERMAGVPGKQLMGVKRIVLTFTTALPLFLACGLSEAQQVARISPVGYLAPQDRSIAPVGLIPERACRAGKYPDLVQLSFSPVLHHYMSAGRLMLGATGPGSRREDSLQGRGGHDRDRIRLARARPLALP